MHIGVIGKGKVGSTLGAAFTRAGHTVTYGIREPSTQPGAQSIEAVARAAEVLVLATPFEALDAVTKALEGASGKVLLDASNPLGPGLSLVVGHTDSGAEVLQRKVPGARVVKCFNTVGIEVMANPQVAGARAMMFFAGADAEARSVAGRLAADLGFEPVDLGGLERARLLEPAAVLWIHLAVVEKFGRRLGLRLEPAVTAAPLVKTPTPRRLAVLGAGHIGGGLTRAWRRAGHEVLVGAREPGDEAIVALERETGAKAMAVNDAVAGADVVALAVPAPAVAALASQADFNGKTVIDCTNHVGPGFTLSYGHQTSWAEEVARLLSGARVFKSFNAQGAENLALPVSAAGPAVNFFCGDDAPARAVVQQLVADVGFEPVFAGPLRQARLLEPLMMLWVQASRALGQRALGFRLLRDAR
jgi:hypothetical protein